jgi:hypothetical protein
MKADILQILHEEATTQYNPDGKDERVINSDEFDTVANQIINLFNNQWISVNDKLPGERERVLCLYEDDYALIGFVDINGSFTLYWADGKATEDEDRPVTHWMPLPSKPISKTEV